MAVGIPGLDPVSPGGLRAATVATTAIFSVDHHISNAGTAGENLGLNAATVIAGVQWVLR